MILLDPAKYAIFNITRERTQESNYFIEQLFYFVCRKLTALKGIRRIHGTVVILCNIKVGFICFAQNSLFQLVKLTDLMHLL
jgi:hypothetical protein